MAPWVNVEIVASVRVSVGAMGSGDGTGLVPDSSDVRDTPAENVLAVCHGLHMCRIDAVSYAAVVVELQAVRYQPNQHLVRKSVSATIPTIKGEVAVTTPAS